MSLQALWNRSANSRIELIRPSSQLTFLAMIGSIMRRWRHMSHPTETLMLVCNSLPVEGRLNGETTPLSIYIHCDAERGHPSQKPEVLKRLLKYHSHSCNQCISLHSLHFQQATHSGKWPTPYNRCDGHTNDSIPPIYDVVMYLRAMGFP